MKYTAHNILLDNGDRTLGNDSILLADSQLWQSVVRSLDLFLPGTKEERSRYRVVDLGCLEGGYAVEFARLGFDTLGIEAREENIAKANYAKEHLGLPNLSFVKDDVRNIDAYGKFDVILNYGLLYHLHDPIDYINKLSRCNTRMMFLHTHYAPEHDPRYGLGFINNYLIAPIQKRIKFLDSTKNFRLSGLQMNEGYRGRWFKEWSRRMNQQGIERSLWASYNNQRSFWPCKKDLTVALHRTGYSHVFEQFDFTGDLVPDNHTYYASRTMFVALK